jgi:2-polyprenyl-3-methyl-5-hydroxy-6-metoxy-1,4-benzoquinol methylase
LAKKARETVIEKFPIERFIGEWKRVLEGQMTGGAFTKDIDDYFRQERSDLEALIPNSAIKILDIGCGEGTLGKRLLKKGIKEVIGIEINPPACKNAGYNLSRVICGDIEEIDLPFSEGYFDCIICGDVLEHLKDPLSVLKKIRNYLSDAGAIIASIPNVRYYGVINMLTEGRWKYEDYGILDRTHLRFFTKKEIEELFHDAGFEITGITENIDPQYNNINPLSQNISFGRVTLNRLNPDELKDLFVIQYLIRAKKVRYALHAEPGNLENQKAELEEYLNAHPADLNMLYKYAEICYKLGFKEKALESLERILIFEPEREDAIKLREKIVDI